MFWKQIDSKAVRKWMFTGIIMILLGVGVVCVAEKFSSFRSARGVKNSVDVSGEVTERKIAYLTFDDGPSVLTENYLDVLEKENAVATFFLIGQQLEGEFVTTVKRAIKNGNEIGVHTYSHQANAIYTSEESYYNDLQKTKKCIEQKLKYQPKLFRFPWGSANGYVQSFKDALIGKMKQCNMDYADWNVSGEDCVGCPTQESVMRNFRRDYARYDEPVILLHDAATCKATCQVLPAIIKELKQNGYSFGTMSQRSESCHFE